MDAGAQGLSRLASAVRALQTDFDGASQALGSDIVAASDPCELLDVVTALSRGRFGGSRHEEAAAEASGTDDNEDPGGSDDSGGLGALVASQLVPQVAEILIGRSFTTTASAQRANAFLQLALAAGARRLSLSDAPEAALPSLVAILDANSPFYLYHGGQSVASTSASSEDGASAGRFVRPGPGTYACGFFSANLEAWGEAGGFSALVELLRGETRAEPGERSAALDASAHEPPPGPLAFEAVQDVLRVVFNTKDHVRPQFLREYLSPFSEAVAVWVERAGPETLAAIPRDALLEVVHVLELLLAQARQKCSAGNDTPWGASTAADRSPDAEEVIERRLHLLRLDVLHALFTSGSLEKRIYGFAEIIAVVTRLYNGHVQEQEEPTADSLRLALSHLVDWMGRRQVIEALFGAKTHAELIKRSTPLLQFAAELECLTPTWLDCVWRCYQGGSATDDAAYESPNLQRHTTHRALTHGLLLELAAFVELPLLMHMLHRLERVPGSAFDETHLSLLAAVALRSFETEDEALEATATVFPLQERVVLHLWQVVLPALEAQELHGQVLSQISEVLRQTAAPSVDGGDRGSAGRMAGRLLEECVANIERRVNVPASLRLLTLIAQLEGEGSVAVRCRREPSGSYVQVILGELSAFKRETSGVERVDVSSEALRGHLERVRTALFALKGAWVLDCSHAAVSSFGLAQADELWDLLVARAVATEEASLCFQWLKFCLRSPPFGQTLAEMVPLHVAQHLLTSRFRTLAGDAISASALSCFQALFSAVNVATGGMQTFALELKPPTDESASAALGAADASVELVASPCDLVGQDELWHLTMHATDPRVAEECVALLVGCCLDVVPALRGTQRLLQSKRGLVERCMDYVRAATAAQAIPDGLAPCVPGVSVVDRCLDLLRYFLEACKGQDVDADGASERDGGSPVTVRRREFAIDSLEERLPFLDVYPSPMKDSEFSEQSVFGTARRPSWTFRHQRHSLLDCIIDERDGSEEAAGDASIPPVPPLLTTHAELQVSVPPAPRFDSSSLRSPTLRPRPHLMQPPSPSPQRGPMPSADDISSILVGRGDVATLEDSCCNGARTQRDREQGSKYDDVSHLLANEGAYFEALLELVDAGAPPTARRAWELLCLLPTNNSLLRKMIRLRSSASGAVGPCQVDWDDLLPPARVYRLVYALRLVEALLIPLEADAQTPLDADGSTDVARRQWRERFVRLGGARHVHDALLEWARQASDAQRPDPAPERVYLDNLRATCFAGMLRTVDYFFKLASCPLRGRLERSAFDARLRVSTLPAFLSSIDAPGLSRAAVELVIADCSAPNMSDEVEESVLAGVELGCSLVQLEPESVAQSLGVDSTESCRLGAWLRAVLADCPRAKAREKAMASLLRLADRADAASDSSAVQRFVDRARDAGCEALIRATAEETAAVDELLALCCGLFRRCGRDPFENEAGTAASSVDALLSGLCAPQGGAAAGSRMELLTAMVRSSATAGELALRWRPPTPQVAALTARSEAQGEWVLAFLMERFVFAGSVAGPASPHAVPPSPQDRSRAQRLALALLFPDGRNQGSSPSPAATSAAIDALLSGQERFHVAVAQEIDRLGRPWSFSPQDSVQEGGDGSRAGLVNPGCVCYMNALLQQLFRVPGFCSGLLALDCSRGGRAARADAPWREEVGELQRLFAAMGHTAKRACDPTAFALSHRDLDGNPTNLRAQMDADEFFCLLLDRLETFLAASTPAGACGAAHFLDECFGGVLVNQVRTESGHLSEREERFFALSLEVTSTRQLADSLALYVQGESLEGENAYFCEREQRKVSATKRICIKTLPRTLVCHLKRFAFDFDVMEKLKIDDRLEFPMEIDMSPYTSAAAAAEGAGGDAECMYDLVGVVVHSGTSDMGHYYSFLKDRGGGGSDDWLEFNDEAVRPFDVEALGDECFGGEEVRHRWDPAQGAVVPAVESKRRSAYMLLYERRGPQPSGSVSESEPRAGVGSEAEAEAFSPDVRALVRDIQVENQRFDAVVHAFGDAYEALVSAVLRGVTSAAAGRVGGVDDEALRRTFQRACEYLLGIRALSSREESVVAANGLEEDPGSLATALADSVCAWLDGGDERRSEGDSERLQFCTWLLDMATTVLPSGGRPDGASSDESARTWLFDALLLSDSDPDLPRGCLRMLTAAVETVVRSLGATAVDYSTDVMLDKLSVLVHALVDTVYARHRELVVYEPACDGAVVVQASKALGAADAAADVLEHIACVFPGAVEPEAAAQSCRSALRHVLDVQADFVARFLSSLETLVDRNVLTVESGADGVALDGAEPLTELHLLVLSKEKRIFTELLRWQEQAEGVDGLLGHSDAVMRRAVVKGLVLAGCEDALSRFSVLTAREGSESECDRIVSLLLSALEDVRSTRHATKALAVLEAALERHRSADEDSDRRSRHVIESVLSPAHGLIEAAAYYKDRSADQRHALALLQLVIRTAARSAALRELFAADPQWQTQVGWIAEWVVRFVDSTGEISRRERANDGDLELFQAGIGDEGRPLAVEDAYELLTQMETGLGVAIFADSKDDKRAERKAIAKPDGPTMAVDDDAEDERVEGRDDENQSEAMVDWRTGRMARKDAGAQQEPEDDEEGVEQAKEDSTLPGSWRARLPRLALDLECAYINTSEA